MSTVRKKHFLHHRAPKGAQPESLPNPEATGALIDLYLQTKELCVVIDNYLLSNNDKEDTDLEDELAFQNLQKFQNLAKAKRHYKAFNLPGWKKLPDHLKHVFRTAACGRDNNSIALSCNLSNQVASKATASSRGAADYIGRKLRNVAIEFGLPPTIALTLENASDRQGNNPGLHFHAALRAPANQLNQLIKRLKKVFAADYVEAWNNRAAFIKPVSTPGGWAAYCTGTLNTPDQCFQDATFSTKQAGQSGELLYNELRDWLRSLPSVKTLEAQINSLKRRPVTAPSCPELVFLVEQHQARRPLLRRERCRKTWEYKKQAANDPGAFHRELAERLGYERYIDQNGEIKQTIHSSYRNTLKALYKLEYATITPDKHPDTTEHPNKLIERYSDHSDFARWATHIQQEELPEDCFDMEIELS